MKIKLPLGKYTPLSCLGFKYRTIRISLLFVVLSFLCITHSLAGEPITARYIKTAGDAVSVRITVSKPAPSNLILEQQLPAGTKILSTSPQAKKANTKKGTVKWLLKGLSPGTLDVSMRVSPAISSKDAKGKIRYRNPETGKMTDSQISR